MRTLLFICLMLTGVGTYAQLRDLPAPAVSLVRWKVTTKPTELFLANVPVTVERVFGKYTLGLTVAYRPSLQGKGDVQSIGKGILGAYHSQYVINFLAQGLYVGMNTKQYVLRGKGQDIYFDLDVYYRSWWYSNKFAQYDNTEAYRFSATRNEQVNVQGFKLLAGRSLY